jgi:hypothetical protein
MPDDLRARLAALVKTLKALHVHTYAPPGGALQNYVSQVHVRRITDELDALRREPPAVAMSDAAQCVTDAIREVGELEIARRYTGLRSDLAALIDQLQSEQSAMLMAEDQIDWLILKHATSRNAGRLALASIIIGVRNDCILGLKVALAADREQDTARAAAPEEDSDA